VDKPDPYVMLRVRTSPNSKQRTTTKNDNVNPEWNEDFKFYLNPKKKNILGMFRIMVLFYIRVGQSNNKYNLMVMHAVL
jgi:Ca2+-dependent lipid-binding protein